MVTGDLKSRIDRIWGTMWSGGICNPLSVIEQVTAAADKAEDAIIDQEQRLREMTAVDIEQHMRTFKACLEGIRST